MASKHSKLFVLAAIEPTNGMSPARAIEAAVTDPGPERTRIYGSDYVPAICALVAKGYTVVEACDKLVALGVPFTAGTLGVEYRRARRKAASI